MAFRSSLFFSVILLFIVSSCSHQTIKPSRSIASDFDIRKILDTIVSEGGSCINGSGLTDEVMEQNAKMYQVFSDASKLYIESPRGLSFDSRLMRNVSEKVQVELIKFRISQNRRAIVNRLNPLANAFLASQGKGKVKICVNCFDNMDALYHRLYEAMLKSPNQVSTQEFDMIFLKMASTWICSVE